MTMITPRNMIRDVLPAISAAAEIFRSAVASGIGVFGGKSVKLMPTELSRSSRSAEVSEVPPKPKAARQNYIVTLYTGAISYISRSIWGTPEPAEKLQARQQFFDTYHDVGKIYLYDLQLNSVAWQDNAFVLDHVGIEYARILCENEGHTNEHLQYLINMVKQNDYTWVGEIDTDIMKTIDKNLENRFPEQYKNYAAREEEKTHKRNEQTAFLQRHVAAFS
jgi:hypothetical protein